MKNIFKVFSLCFFCLIYSCSHKNKLKDIDTFESSLPAHFPTPNYSVHIESYKIELGKKLFYDPIFSKDSTISCSSCHKQNYAFSDNRRLSLGVRNQTGKRNALALQNLMWSNSFFWDGGVGNIDLIPLNPITNHRELDESLINIAHKINRSKIYRNEIQKIYSSDTISTHQILEVLTHFQSALISDKSKFDKFIQGKIALTPNEMQGYQLFKMKCGHCHSGILQSNYSFKNNGIYKVGDIDLGRYEISLLETDKGKFKVPSLRNVELTSPYMHNSALNTLEDVLNHYEFGINQSPSLDSTLQNKIPFSKGDKTKIIQFLKTLTDKEFITNPKFKP